LQYVAESLPQPLPGTIKPGVVEALAAAAGDRIRMEQYLDFLRCRVFRCSLVCHAAARPDPDRAVARVMTFAASSTAKPATDAPDPDPEKKERFVVSNSVQFATADPPLRAALWRMWQARPAAVPFAELHTAAESHGRTKVPPRELADGLLQLYLAGVIELHLHLPVLAAAAGPRPCASPFTRLQAERGDAKLFSLRFGGVDPDPFARYLLPLLDGSRSREELLERLAERSAAGEFAVNDGEGRAANDPAQVRSVLAGWVETALQGLARSALLTA
jgi:hypothetical protein